MDTCTVLTYIHTNDQYRIQSAGRTETQIISTDNQEKTPIPVARSDKSAWRTHRPYGQPPMPMANMKFQVLGGQYGLTYRWQITSPKCLAETHTMWAHTKTTDIRMLLVGWLFGWLWWRYESILTHNLCSSQGSNHLLLPRSTNQPFLQQPY